MKIDGKPLPFQTTETAKGPASSPHAPVEADGSKEEAASFEKMVIEGIEGVNRSMARADELSAMAAAGEPVGIAETMVAVAKADLSFRLLLQVRNKALSAYEEIMRLQF